MKPTSRRILIIYCGFASLVVIGVSTVAIGGRHVDAAFKLTSRPAMIAMFFWPLLLQVAVYMLFHRIRRGLTRRLAAASGRLCPRCEYPLPGAVDGVCVCPECGHKDTEENIRAAWKKWGYLG